MTEYLDALALLALLFVGFGLLHGNGRGAGGCTGCAGCADPSACRNGRNQDNAASGR